MFHPEINEISSNENHLVVGVINKSPVNLIYSVAGVLNNSSKILI
jgi:hypothetical protein